jgi:hypothetical protein
MENQVKTGRNRTGAQMAPVGASDVETYARSRLGEGRLDGEAYFDMHRRYINEAERVGSVPVPATVKGMASTVVDKLKGDKPSVLIDKLGERLAFERTGVRLYEALVIKCTALNGTGEGPLDISTVRNIRDDEETHFRLITEALKVLGADPTSMTPCADIAGVSAMGWLQVMTDPRTTVAQALNTMLAVELVDNASWELLQELAIAAGHKDMAEGFSIAAQAEQRHLTQIRSWLRDSVMAEAT